jgi:predicted 2-oxoglutarate/Fe(II)-dependent dioxygenase YbiX
VEEEFIRMKKGDCVYFNGKVHQHGVTPVTSGSRVSLNVWTFPKIDEIVKNTIKLKIF